jgi:hypothetical protein
MTAKIRIALRRPELTREENQEREHGETTPRCRCSICEFADKILTTVLVPPS